ncbi:Apulose-4-phosphate transketolase subunit A [Dyadobacter sp. CECT 9275]|uniref:Apulose-4-phosphate transketolase subunit A n=1 Tax=Dyadobacter helix TaxID=2822344 RepID=A0A916NCL4_9BACT|nr:transketolase [Dyadobacter sp. CECT 9275]CAG5002840.1 Apulose-4-phosphate transketolase subunit A [Dyadobacter sp. CECT 9275]
MTVEEITNDPRQISGELRLKILGLYHQANAGHIGCSLSCIDLMIGVLFLNKDTNDTFILSKGHAAAALYACLNTLGEITDEELATFYLDGTTLPAHPAPRQYKGIPFATGSLGHGLPIATGIAHAAKVSGEDSISFALLSDGETNEGTTWEAANYAIANQLDNLIMIIDKNGLQGFGFTDKVLGETAAIEKWNAIGFETVAVDGHDILEVSRTIKELKSHKNGLPKAIIADTVKGKGVSYMENKLEWHYLPMNQDQYAQAILEVKERYLNEFTNA